MITATENLIDIRALEWFRYPKDSGKNPERLKKRKADSFGENHRETYLRRDATHEVLHSRAQQINQEGGERMKKNGRHLEFEAIWNEAYEAGMRAGEAAMPHEMVVVGGGKEYHVPEGPCGFAWIVVYPGNAPFANWAKKAHDARPEYGGGCCVYWVGEFNQSVERKAAFARAFAEVLRQHGIKAYGQDRLD